MKSPDAPPWKISVRRKHILVEKFDVPAHKLGPHEVERFLHALVVRLRAKTLKDMVPYYVNGRRGLPDKKVFDFAGRYENDELTEVGYWYGGWECYAVATQSMTEEYGEIVRALRAQNQKV